MSVFAALLFYALNVLIANWNTLVNFYPNFGFLGSINFFITLMISFGAIIKTHSYVSLLIISVLIGMLFSLIFYKTYVVKINGNKKLGFFAGIGLFLSALAPGCAACGIGLASALGLSAAVLTIFPFEGLEISILAIGILIYAIYKVSNSSCKVNLEKVKGGDKNE